MASSIWNFQRQEYEEPSWQNLVRWDRVKRRAADEEGQMKQVTPESASNEFQRATAAHCELLGFDGLRNIKQETVMLFIEDGNSVTFLAQRPQSEQESSRRRFGETEERRRLRALKRRALMERKAIAKEVRNAAAKPSRGTRRL